MKRSNRPIVRLAFVIALSGLLSSCVEDEPQAYFNRVVFQNQQQCSTYLTNVECSKFFEKIRQDLESNRLTKFRTYTNQKDCQAANNRSCEIYQYPDVNGQPQIVWIGNPHYYVAELDRDYNEQNNYSEDMRVVDYNVIYDNPLANTSNGSSNTSTSSNSQGTNFLGFYYFGYMNNGQYSNVSGSNNYYRQPIAPRAGSYASANGRSYSGSYTASRASVSRGGFASGGSSSS